MTYHIKFKDKTSQQWFKSTDFESKEEMMAHYWSKIRPVACDVKFNSPKVQKEETTMDAKAIVEKIVTGDAVAVEEAFKAILETKTAEAKEALRPAVYGQVFGAPTKAEKEAE